MPITKGFNHVATLSTDLDRHADFYQRVFGAELVFRMDAADDHPRMWSLFFRDVDGMELEVCAKAEQ